VVDPSEQAMVLLLAATLLFAWLLPWALGWFEDSPPDDGSDGGGGSGPPAPRSPEPPRGGLPLPDAEPARARRRDRHPAAGRHLRSRRATREPSRVPERV
jgi:hypothetical protein